MPFTGSHPAAVLPFVSVLPASALIVGSMAPDFPYYLPLTTTSWPTHTSWGIVSIDLVLGLTVWVVWHALIAAPAIAYAPRGLRARLAGRVEPGLRQRAASVRQIGVVAVALILGAASHVLWDEFTHPHRWGMNHIPALAEQWGPLPGYRWSQYGSGLVGAGVEALWLWAWWRRTTPVPVPASAGNGWTWVTMPAVGAVAGCWAAATSPSLQRAAFNGATAGGGAIAAVAFVLAATWHLHHRRASVR